MVEATARYQAVRRCVTCHERLTDRQVWDSNRVCPHCGEVTGGQYSRYCDTYTTSELRATSPKLRNFETTVRRSLDGTGVVLVSLSLGHYDGLPAWETRVKVRGREARLILGGITDDPYAAPESLASGIAEAVKADKRAQSRALAPAPQRTMINDLRLLLADLGISATWRAGLTRVRRLLTVGVRLR